MSRFALNKKKPVILSLQALIGAIGYLALMSHCLWTYVLLGILFLIGSILASIDYLQKSIG